MNVAKAYCLDESIGDSEMLLDVLVAGVEDIESQVAEVFGAFGVLSSRDVEDVRDTLG
jgi:hypothetical protein